MHKGYITLHRKIQDNLIWQSKPFSKGQAWIDILFLASYRQRTLLVGNMVINLERGQLFTSEQKLADRWGWSKKQVKTYLALLERLEMVTKEGTAKGTIVTVEKYELYQDVSTTESTTEGTAQEPQRDRFGTAQGTQKNKVNKEKEVNKVNKDIYISVPDALKPAFMEFADMRKKKKKPITTESTVKHILNKLDKFASCTEDKIAILNQSTDNCWTDVYELKEKNVTVRPAKNKAAENLNDFYEMIGEWAGEEQ